MIWYLLFCAAGYKGGVVCLQPMMMPDQETCIFLARKMEQTSNDVGRTGSGRCVSIKRRLP